MSTATDRPIVARRHSDLRTVGTIYLVLCALTLGSAFVLGFPPHSALAEWWIGDRLNLQPHTVPSLGDALGLLAHNLRVAGWPLLFVALGLHRGGWTRELGTILVCVFATINTAFVGAAIAVGGSAIWAYLPHLPVEWAALALSTATWVIATDDDIERRRLGWFAGGFVLLLAVAAVLETYAVPHL